MGGFGDVKDFSKFNAISDEIAANPGVFANDAERAAFETVMQHAYDNAADAQTKLKIVQTAVAAIKGGLTGGLSGALASILGSMV